MHLSKVFDNFYLLDYNLNCQRRKTNDFFQEYRIPEGSILLHDLYATRNKFRTHHKSRIRL